MMLPLGGTFESGAPVLVAYPLGLTTQGIVVEAFIEAFWKWLVKVKANNDDHSVCRQSIPHMRH